MDLLIKKEYYLFLFVLVSFLFSCHSISVEEELTLTKEQKQALDELKNQIDGKLSHEYMYREIYLIKFLRFQYFDVQKAKKSLLNTMKWRRENLIDDILEEDYSIYGFVQRFPFWLDGRDYQNRPVGTADVSVWDPRQAVISGDAEKLLRYAYQVIEMGCKMVRDDQESGKNVTQFTLIFNMAGFNLLQHACLQCIPFYIRFLAESDQYYPLMIHKQFYINTPSAFEVLLRIARPLLDPQTMETLSVHGTNKKEWQKAVYKEIDPSQIRRQFGGTKNSDLDDF